MPQDQTKPVEIVLNGDRRDVPEGLTVLDLLGHLGVDSERVAVELNRSIVRRAEWPVTRIGPGSQIEVVQFVGGG